MPTTASAVNLQYLNGDPAELPITAAADDIAGSVVESGTIPTVAHASHLNGDLIAGQIGTATYRATQRRNGANLPAITAGPIWYRPSLNALVSSPTTGDRHFGFTSEAVAQRTADGQTQEFLVVHCPDGRTT